MYYKDDASSGGLIICAGFNVARPTAARGSEIGIASCLKMDLIKTNVLYLGGALFCVALARV